MRYFCDGRTPALRRLLDIDGQPTTDEEFAVTDEMCDCGAEFDGWTHSTLWPHDFIPPVKPARVITDLPELFGFL